MPVLHTKLNILLLQNPDDERIKELVKLSSHDAAKWIKDTDTGDLYFWPSDQAFHAQVAASLSLQVYEKGIAI